MASKKTNYSLGYNTRDRIKALAESAKKINTYLKDVVVLYLTLLLRGGGAQSGNYYLM